MASRRKLIPAFVVFSFGALTYVHIREGGHTRNDIQPYEKFPSSWKSKVTVSHTPRSQENALRLQDEFYGPGCEANPFREGLRTLLNAWSAMAERRNISTYFICFGSMLGSLRNGDIVPLDTDVDVCMLRKDYHKLYAEESTRPLDLNDGNLHLLLQRHSPHPLPDTPRRDCKGAVVRTSTDECTILDPHARLYIHAKIYVDIFMIEDQGTTFWDEYRDRFHKRDVLFPLKPCTYLGISTKCPQNPAEYLTTYYGTKFIAPLTKCKNGRWVPNVEPNINIRIFLFILVTMLMFMSLRFVNLKFV